MKKEHSDKDVEPNQIDSEYAIALNRSIEDANKGNVITFTWESL